MVNSLWKTYLVPVPFQSSRRSLSLGYVPFVIGRDDDHPRLPTAEYILLSPWRDHKDDPEEDLEEEHVDPMAKDLTILLALLQQII
ncbi:hypothetical protein RJT34_17023 [Clitoria ternatea]|uniref:Uncharacterized protein n=1 Tax=Clitoria ternatea TaxID=43366 RepID=A0AAN9PCS0_CLITE